MKRVEDLVDALKAVELENVKEELMGMTKLNELLNKKEEKKTSKVVWVFAIIGVIVAIAAIAYAVYRYFAPDYYDDFEEGESYLELSRSEEDMIAKVCSEFDKVIVIINAIYDRIECRVYFSSL